MASSQHDPLTLRPLGRTGLSVPSLCIGCAALGSMPEAFTYTVSEEQARITLEALLEGPVPFLDTAAAYGDGESERRLGQALRARGGLPPGFVLSSKADRDLRTGDFSGAQIRRSLERSLRLLGLDRLQLCYLHDPEHTTFAASMAPGGPVDTLLRCKEEGLIDHVGIAGGPIPMMVRYVETGLFEAAITHNRYTLLNVAAEPLFAACARHDVALLNAAPYGGGILAKDPSAFARYAYREAPPEILERAVRLSAICARHGVPLAAAALRFSLRDPRVVSTIVGISRPERLAQTLDFATRPIPDALWDELAEVTPATDDPEGSSQG